MVSGFDESTCLGEIVCITFENDGEIITEHSIVWFNTNKAICQGNVIKMTFSEFPKDSNN